MIKFIAADPWHVEVRFDALMMWHVGHVEGNMDYVITETMAMAIVRYLKQVRLIAPQLP